MPCEAVSNLFETLQEFSSSYQDIAENFAKVKNHEHIKRPTYSTKRPEVIKFTCPTQLSLKFIRFINVKMPTIFGILTIISSINTASERYKARKICILQYLSFYEPSNFLFSVELC